MLKMGDVMGFARLIRFLFLAQKYLQIIDLLAKVKQEDPGSQNLALQLAQQLLLQLEAHIQVSSDWSVSIILTSDWSTSRPSPTTRTRS